MASSVYTGYVVSGTGSSYMVKLNTGSTVAATALQIDSSQTVPANTYVLLVLIGSTYYFQPPVWLAPAS